MLYFAVDELSPSPRSALDVEPVRADSSVAEHLTFNQGVVGSNPTRLTKEPPFDGGFFFALTLSVLALLDC